MLTVSVCPFTSVGSFAFMGPLPFCVDLLHLYKTFHYHMGPFHLRERPGPHRRWEGTGVIFAGSDKRFAD